MIFLIGCSKQVDSPADDSCYIVDDSVILMLCEEPKQEEYKKIIGQLKGNANMLESTITEFKELKQSANVKNALGVAYLRLRQFDIAEGYLKEALAMTNSEEEKACILTNMAECRLYMEDDEGYENYIAEASEKQVNDPVRRLVLKSNLLLKELNEKEEFIKVIAEAKKMLKEEKRLLGSNQFIGIFNYRTLATACYASDNMKKCDYYINQALELNNKVYKYKFVDAMLYNDSSFFFKYNDVEKSLTQQNKCIDILEQWQSKDFYDLLKAYIERGNIYFQNGDMEKAIADYQVILERGSLDNVWLPISYYGMGETHNNPIDMDNAIEFYARAFYLWKQEDWEVLNSDIKDKLKNIYKDKNNSEIGFEDWFQEQIRKAETDLKNQY